MMADEKFGQVRVRAFGSYSARITDIPRFFREYAGAYPVLTIRDLEVQLRDYIAAKFGEVLATQQISVLDVAANLSAVNARLLPAIAPYFLDLGVTLTQFTVTSVTLPDEVNEYYDKVTSMNMIGDMSRFQAFNTAIATANPNTAAGQGVQGGMAMGIAMGQVQQQLGTPAQQGFPAQPMQPAQPAAPSPSAPSAWTDDPVERLAKLKKMFEAGLITADEFNAKKSQIIEAL